MAMSVLFFLSFLFLDGFSFRRIQAKICAAFSGSPENQTGSGPLRVLKLEKRGCTLCFVLMSEQAALDVLEVLDYSRNVNPG